MNTVRYYLYAIDKKNDVVTAKIPPEQIFYMWRDKWFKVHPELKELFKSQPRKKDEFLAKSEVSELTEFPRPILLEAIDNYRLLAEILENAKLLLSNPSERRRPKMKPVEGSNEFGFTSVERGASLPRNSRTGGF